MHWQKIHSLILFFLSLVMAWETFPHWYTFSQNYSWIFETLQLLHCKMLNVKWEKIHSIILFYLSLVMAWETFPHSYTSPWNYLWIFKTLQVIIFWVRVTHKMLNWEKIHSIILSVTCHGLRNFPPLIHIPLKLFVNFQNPTSYYFLS